MNNSTGMLREFLQQIDSGKLMQRKIMNFLCRNSIRSHDEHVTRPAILKIHSIKNNQMSGSKFGRKDKIKEILSDSCSYILEKNMIWQVTAGLQVSYDSRTESVVANQHIATAKDRHVTINNLVHIVPSLCILMLFLYRYPVNLSLSTKK